MRHVLIVHHDAELTRNLSVLLPRYGFRVTIVDFLPQLTGAGIASHRPDAIILSERLKIAEGAPLSAWLRQYINCAIISICDRGDDLAGIMMVEQGADCYMTTPLNYRELLERLKSILRRYETQSHATA